MTAAVAPSQPMDTAARQHSATPWRVSGFEKGAGGASRVIMGDDGFSIAHVMDRTAAENEADAELIIEAVNSHASLKARIEELTSELADYKQAASVEAGLRREFAGRVGNLEHPFRNVDELDWKHLLSFIPDSGHGRFWKAVFAEVRAALPQSSGVARAEK